VTIWQPCFFTSPAGNMDFFDSASLCYVLYRVYCQQYENKKPDSAENLFPPRSPGCIQLTDLLPPLGIHLSQLIQYSTDRVATAVTTVWCILSVYLLLAYIFLLSSEALALVNDHTGGKKLEESELYY
jgi:hypothetical protein